jgi:hypothetical protein
MKKPLAWRGGRAILWISAAGQEAGWWSACAEDTASGDPGANQIRRSGCATLGDVAVRSRLATIAAPVAAAVLAVGALAACGDEDRGVETEPVTCTTQGPTAGQPTAPGMLLCPGTSGHLPLTDASDRHHLVPVTVTSVDQVPRSDVDRLTRHQLGLDVDPTAIDVYAVHAQARIARPARLDPLRDLLLYSEENDFADPHVLSTWSPAGCRHREFTAVMPAGTVLRTCDWRAVTRGADLTGVTLGSEIDDYAVYGGNPVSWSLRDD